MNKLVNRVFFKKKSAEIISTVTATAIETATAYKAYKATTDTAIESAEKSQKYGRPKRNDNL